MRSAIISLLGVLVSLPAAAQGYYQQPAYGYQQPSYGYAAPYAGGPAQQGPGAWSAAREEWHRAHRAEDIARWRAANGDVEGANRAQAWADRHREQARRNAYIARGGY